MPIHINTPFILGVQALVLGIIVWIVRDRLGRRWPIWRVEVLAAALVIAGVVGVGTAAAGDPTPMSQVPNPLPDTAAVVDAGRGVFQANCARCHGVDALGGGPDSTTTQIPPPALVGGHTATHSDGDLFYWITNGLPGGMPAWGPALSETQRWSVIRYIRSLVPQPGSGTLVGPVSTADAGTIIGVVVAAVVVVGALAWLILGRRRASGSSGGGADGPDGQAPGGPTST